MTSDDIKDYIFAKYGDLTILSDANTYIRIFNSYIARQQNNINKAYQALLAQYDALDNNDVTTETVILNRLDANSMTPSETKVSEYNKSFDANTLENTSYTENQTLSDAVSTPHNTLCETFGNQTLNDYNNTSKTLERKHGNISAVTNQSIISQELDLRLRDYASEIIDKAVLYGGVYYAN